MAGPLSEKVLVVSPVFGVDKIFFMRSDGLDLHRLTHVPGEQREPCYSQILGRVFFVGQAGRQSQIFSVNLDGEDLRQHTSGRLGAHQPTVSPDGTKLIYSTDAWGERELVEMDLESGRQTRLTYDQATNLFPRYSPDGTRVLYLSRRYGHADLFVLQLENNQTHRLTNRTFDGGPGVWSPDGRMILTTERVPPNSGSRLFEIDEANKVLQPLLGSLEHVQSSSYTSDGSAVLLVDQNQLFIYDRRTLELSPFPWKKALPVLQAWWLTVPLP